MARVEEPLHDDATVSAVSPPLRLVSPPGRSAIVLALLAVVLGWLYGAIPGLWSFASGLQLLPHIIFIGSACLLLPWLAWPRKLFIQIPGICLILACNPCLWWASIQLDSPYAYLALVFWWTWASAWGVWLGQVLVWFVKARDRRPVRRPGVAFGLSLAPPLLLLGIVLLVWVRVPLRVMFQLTRPALEQVKPGSRPQWIGIYHVVGRKGPRIGILGYWTRFDHGSNSGDFYDLECGFLQADAPPADEHTPRGSTTYVPLGENWYTYEYLYLGDL